MRSKAYQTIKEKVPTETIDIKSAVAFLIEHKRPNFDETIELHVRLGVGASKSDQMVRSVVTLPAGPAKQQRIIVFTDDADLQQKVKAAGATAAGGEELIKQIVDQGSLDADITIATPNMMPKVASAAKILGPQGLMPNPKTGTVSDDPVETVKQLQAGQLAFKMDQLGNIHLSIGKTSWTEDKIIDNTTAALQAIKAARPSSAKGEFLRSVTLKATMSPAVRVTA